MNFFDSSGRAAMVVCFAVVCFAFPCGAQELVPRRWSHLPLNTNFGGTGYVSTTAQIGFDPVLLIENADLDLHSFPIKYIRSFKFLGKSARVDLLQAYQDATWTGLLDGVPTTVKRSGWSDLSIRFAANLIGAPPLNAAEFKKYRAGLDRETIVGIGLIVQLPTGDYLDEKLLNLGTNRVTFRPQLGAVHRRQKWAFETTISSWIFTDNDRFFDGKLLEQDPLFTIQQHLDYTLRPGLWAGAGVAYAQGARSTVDGIRKDNETQNLAWLFSIGVPINRQLGVKIAYLGSRTLTSVGADTDSLVTAVSVFW